MNLIQELLDCGTAEINFYLDRSWGGTHCYMRNWDTGAEVSAEADTAENALLKCLRIIARTDCFDGRVVRIARDIMKEKHIDLDIEKAPDYYLWDMAVGDFADGDITEKKLLIAKEKSGRRIFMFTTSPEDNKIFNIEFRAERYDDEKELKKKYTIKGERVIKWK
jgi:hypothetical protein